MRNRLRQSVLSLLAVSAWQSAVGIVAAQEEAGAKVTYDEHVQPIFRQHCFTCHGADEAKSDLRVDNYAALMRGGASGEVVIPGDTDFSRLWTLVSHQETPEMPPKQDKLPEETLNTIKAWIAGGALENSGSTAKIKAKPKVELKVAAGSGRPEGPPPMPEGITRQPVVLTQRAGAITALAASPWAPVVAVAGQKQILLYHTDTAELLGVLPFPEGTPYVLKFSRSGALLLAGGGRGGASGKVVLFDIKNGQRVAEIGDELDAVTAADINDDHTQVALGGPRKIVKIYSVADGTQLFEIKKHTDWITSIEYSPDGALLATADRSSGLFVWEAETAREYQNLKGHTAAVTSVSWRTDGNLLASGSEDGTVKLWEMENGGQVKNWNAHGGVECVAFTHDGRLVSTGRDRTVRTWTAVGAQEREFPAFNDVALQCAFAHDGARVIGGDFSGEVRIWNAADAAPLAQLSANPPSLDAVALAAAEKARAAREAADQAVAHANAAAKTLEEKLAAIAQVAEQLKSLQATAEQLNAEKAAMEQAVQAANEAAKVANEAAETARVSAEKAETARAESAATAQAGSGTPEN